MTSSRAVDRGCMAPDRTRSLSHAAFRKLASGGRRGSGGPIAMGALKTSLRVPRRATLCTLMYANALGAGAAVPASRVSRRLRPSP